jgi:ankyrin repeat protein
MATTSPAVAGLCSLEKEEPPFGQDSGSKQHINLGGVEHTGDNVASPNSGVKVAGHILGIGGEINLTTRNTYNYLATQADGADAQTEVLNWLEHLAGLDFSRTQEINLSKRHDRTGTWFLEQAIFKAWYDGLTRTLWCHGIPGAGKTVMASIVIDYLKNTTKSTTSDTACLFIFFDEQNTAEQTAHRLCIELLRQLVSQQVEVSDKVRHLYSSCGRRCTSPSQHDVLDAVRQELTRFSRTWLVIDALDACPAHARENRREDFLRVIRTFPPTVNFLITSRQRNQQMRQWDAEEEVEITLNQHDLRRFIEGRIEHHKSRNGQLANVDVETVIKGVSEQAQGMFLLAHLHMEDIVAQRDMASIQSTIENLPSQIDETYEKAWQRIPTEDLSLATRIFQWITFAVRPLTLQELRYALAVNEAVTNVSTARLHMFTEECFTTVCAGLVTIDLETEANFIRFVHSTAESYFKKKFDENEGHRIIATACLQYLLFEELQSPAQDYTQLLSRLEDLSFLPYAALHWGDHTRNTQDPNTIDLALKFLSQRNHLISATQVLEFLDPEESTSALWLAAHFGLSVVVERLLSANPSILAETMFGETAMHAAAERGYFEVVKQLCSQQDIKPDHMAEAERTPLSLAAEKGHDAIVKQLLDTGKVDPDSHTTFPFYQGRTPLSWAAGNGHKEIVTRLLNTGRVNVDSVIGPGPYIGRTPLMWAAANGHYDAVESLLNCGKANPGLHDGSGRTALSYAAENGHDSIVETLLKTGRAALSKRDLCGQRAVDLAYKANHKDIVKRLLTYPSIEDARDEDGRMPLFYESEQGNADLVDVLLGLNANPNMKDEDDCTPLVHAAENGHIKVAALLLDSGADLEVQCEEDRTPLSYAAEAGHQEMVKFLVLRGAHSDTPDHHGRTPLSYAAQNGHEDAVSCLLTGDKLADPCSLTTSGVFRGLTPLLLAIKNGHMKVVEMLLKRKVDVNLNQGVSSLQGPMMWAAMSGREDAVRLILKTGKVELKDEDQLFGRPAKDWARDHGF